MIRGTTPTLICRLKTALDLNTVVEAALTIKGDNYSKTWKSEDLMIDAAEKTVSLSMTQEETLQYSSGKVEVQIRFLTNTGKALATNIVKTSMSRILQEGVLTND